MNSFSTYEGDPTGTGKGGASIYGDKFEDEITKELKHSGAGYSLKFVYSSKKSKIKL